MGMEENILLQEILMKDILKMMISDLPRLE